jgi:hypothetical protein
LFARARRISRRGVSSEGHANVGAGGGWMSKGSRLVVSVAMLAGALGARRGGAEEITFPGGTLTPPAGCRGQIHQGVDGVLGWLTCRSGALQILVDGGAFIACPDHDRKATGPRGRAGGRRSQDQRWPTDVSPWARPRAWRRSRGFRHRIPGCRQRRSRHDDPDRHGGGVSYETEVRLRSRTRSGTSDCDGPHGEAEGGAVSRSRNASWPRNTAARDRCRSPTSRG